MLQSDVAKSAARFSPCVLRRQTVSFEFHGFFGEVELHFFTQRLVDPRPTGVAPPSQPWARNAATERPLYPQEAAGTSTNRTYTGPYTGA